ncbi:14619_t:CDS:2, partial [Cetraspora pellucida]
SKNYNRQHIIDLMALTDITKSKNDKYGQKNHFLWIKNINRLLFKDTAHHGKRYICKKCTISWPSEKSLAYHQKHCFSLEEATQRVKLSIKDDNDFEKFKNYGRMINALCLAEQKANSFCYLVYWIDTGNVWGPFLYRGENATQEFVKRIDKKLVQINTICKNKFDRNNKDKVSVHCHITVVFHNFRGYDSHLVCESVGKFVNAHQIKVIAETFERYKSMKVGQLKYIDSMQFMNNSLANLTKNLGNNYSITSQHFKDYSSDQISLASHKGVYPYDYIDSQERFKETELLSIHEFHSILKGKISQDDYHHAQKVWKTFSCKTLEEYHNLYLKIDVLSLADIWTQFRITCMQYYELDPSHYVSAPALAWDAMLKMTGVKIELFTDMSMYDFKEDAKRKTFDPSKPTIWISYIDANNLYGWAMSQYLLIGNYKWEVSHKYLKDNPNEQKKYFEKILNTKADAKREYFLKINTHFSLKTHDYLSDLSPAVENIAVSKDMLCPYTTELVDNLDSRRFSATEKLVPHLVFNTEKQQGAKNAFEKDFFKLMNNSVYGKTMENIRKYQDVKLMAMNNEQDEKKFINQIRKPSFKYAKQLGNTLVGAHMGKASVTLNKPIIVGASVLGLSKLLIYHFWYRYVKERYGDKAQLGYKDTDSYLFQVKTKDIYKDMAERPDLFDLNDSKTIGLFKDETPGNVITESYHIRAKSYHYVLADKSTKSKHKGVSKKGINEMATNLYMPVLEGSLLDDPIDRSLLSEQEAMQTEKALCPIDTKRWILSDKITSLPYWHWCIQAYKNFVSNEISSELAEQRALSVKLSK